MEECRVVELQEVKSPVLCYQEKHMYNLGKAVLQKQTWDLS